MIFPQSRYQNTGTYALVLPNGTSMTVLRLPQPGRTVLQGYYRQRNERRLDLAANFFLQDATAFWQLCDANDAVVPDALAARPLIGIPPTGQ